MAMAYRYINKQVEPSYVGYSLILEDREAGTHKRLEQAFKVDISLIDDEFLYQNAQVEIAQFVEELALIAEVQDGSPNE